MQSDTHEEKPSQKKLLTKSDFLAEYNIGHTKFYQEVREGHLKICHPFGKRTFIKRAEANRWFKELDNRQNPPTREIE